MRRETLPLTFSVGQPLLFASPGTRRERLVHGWAAERCPARHGPIAPCTHPLLTKPCSPRSVPPQPRCLADEGAVVLSGRERPGDHGETVVTLLLGLPGRPTHELRLVQHPRGRVQAAGGRLAIVVFGFGEDVEQSGRFFDLPAPFAV